VRQRTEGMKISQSALHSGVVWGFGDTRPGISLAAPLRGA